MSIDGPRGTSQPWLRRVLVANLVVEVLIVVTGGLVRLTGSGLGCPTWPRCVPGSYIPVAHQAQGFHKYIEFGNRMLTGVVTIAAVAAVVGVWRWARGRRDLLRLAALVLAGVAVQAVLGGITVRTHLSPATVAAHMLISMTMVSASTVLLWRAHIAAGPTRGLAHPAIISTARVTALLGGVVVVLGTVVTGSGPHSGDAAEPARFGFDPRSVAWLHADSVTLFCGLAVGVVVALRATSAPRAAVRAWYAVLAVTVLQAVIGYTQYFTGLPAGLVELHMLGACLLVIALTRGVLSLRETTSEARVASTAESVPAPQL